MVTNPIEEALKVPGARATLPVSAGREPFGTEFIAEAHAHWGNFHMQMGGDHAVYYASRLSEFLPMALAPATGEVSRIARNPVSGLGDIAFTLKDGSVTPTLDQYVQGGDMRVRSVMLLHKGQVVYEDYPGLHPDQPHFWASVTKSTVGLLLTLLEEDGVVDTTRPVTAYAPALAGSEWDKVSVIDALNMSVGLDIQEDLDALLDPMSMFQRVISAEFGVPNGEGVVENTLSILAQARPLPGEAPGKVARYSTLSTKVLVYVIEGATGRSFVDLFGERVWSRIGARQAFLMGLGADGTAGAYGLAYTTLEDLARYALLYTPSWKTVSATQVVSDRTLKTLQTSGDAAAYARGNWPDGWVSEVFPGDLPVFNSRQFDAVWSDGAMFKHGNLFQGIYIDPARDVVGVFFSTTPMTSGIDLLPGYIRAAARQLAGR